MLKFVLTGGPCTGKTTLLESLGSIGYQIVPEAATLLIKSILDNGDEALLNDIKKFQLILFKKQLELESKAVLDKDVFIDRGIIDGIAYCKFFKVKPPTELLKYIKYNRYNGVFLLDFLSNYSTDIIRRESLSQALIIHRLLKESYQEYGYNVIEIPAMDIVSRLHYIFLYLKEQNIPGLKENLLQKYF